MQQSLLSLGFLSDSMIEQSETQNKAKQAMIDTILHGQGPVVNSQTFIDRMSDNEFLIHAQLLSPKHGKIVSYFCPGITLVQKCFVKKPPSQLSASPGIDIERYSQRYFAPIHSSITPDMQAALRDLGYLSNQFIIDDIPGINKDSDQIDQIVVKMELNETDNSERE